MARNVPAAAGEPGLAGLEQDRCAGDVWLCRESGLQIPRNLGRRGLGWAPLHPTFCIPVPLDAGADPCTDPRAGSCWNCAPLVVLPMSGQDSEVRTLLGSQTVLGWKGSTRIYESNFSLHLECGNFDFWQDRKNITSMGKDSAHSGSCSQFWSGLEHGPNPFP